MLERLREWDPPILATISGGKVRLDLATIADADIPEVAEALRTILSAEKPSCS